MTKATNNHISCITCQHSCLMRYGNGPVIAECLIAPQPMNERFPYERQVAKWPINCPGYKQTDKAKETRIISKTLREAV